MLSFPGDLSLYIETFKSSLSVITPSHLKVWFSWSLGRDTLWRKFCIHSSDQIRRVFLKKEFNKLYNASFICRGWFSFVLFLIPVQRQPWVLIRMSFTFLGYIFCLGQAFAEFQKFDFPFLLHIQHLQLKNC